MAHRVFVYGSLKQGFGNHRLLTTSTFLGPTRTLSRKYEMYSMGAFPAVLDQGKYAIHGELYEVDDATLKDLDRLEGNGSFYNRKEIYLEDGSKAWIYFIMKPSWRGSHQNGNLPRDRVKSDRNHGQTWLPSQFF